MELNVLNEKKLDQIREITGYRSRTLKLHHYYTQIEGICCDLVDDTQNILDEEAKKLFRILIRKSPYSDMNLSRFGNIRPRYGTFTNSSWMCTRILL